MSCRWSCRSQWEESPRTQHGRSNNARAQDEEGTCASELSCTQALWSETGVPNLQGASPQDCAEITARYARISRSQNWLIFLLSPRNTDVHSAQGSSQQCACGLSSRHWNLWPGQKVPFTTAGTIRETAYTPLWLPSRRSCHAFKGSHIRQGKSCGWRLDHILPHTWSLCFIFGPLREDI